MRSASAACCTDAACCPPATASAAASAAFAAAICARPAAMSAASPAASAAAGEHPTPGGAAAAPRRRTCSSSRYAHSRCTWVPVANAFARRGAAASGCSDAASIYFPQVRPCPDGRRAFASGTSDAPAQPAAITARRGG